MISVCMATYNGADHLEEQLRSILCQISIEDEIIISDDGSTDDTLSIIKSFNDDRIKVLNHKKEPNNKSKHQLVTSNFENALKNAKNEYIFLADQDDIWKANKVIVSLPYLQTYDVVYSNYEVIDDVNRLLKKNFYNDDPVSFSVIQNVITMPFHGCCMAFKRSVLKNALPFPPALPVHDNWIGILHSIQNRKKIKYIEEPLVFYRQHHNNVSGVSTNSLYTKIWYRMVFIFQIYRRYFFKAN